MRQRSATRGGASGIAAHACALHPARDTNRGPRQGRGVELTPTVRSGSGRRTPALQHALCAPPTCGLGRRHLHLIAGRRQRGNAVKVAVLSPGELNARHRRRRATPRRCTGPPGVPAQVAGRRPASSRSGGRACARRTPRRAARYGLRRSGPKAESDGSASWFQGGRTGQGWRALAHSRAGTLGLHAPAHSRARACKT